MTISSNFGNIFSILFASIFLPFLPMLPVQILILNILYDISQISIPWDNVDNEFLSTQKKWSSKSIKKFMLWVGPISSICDILLFYIMYKILNYDISLFNSGWFITSMITQLIIIQFIRTKKRPFIESNISSYVLFSTVGTCIISMILPYIKIGSYVGLVPIPFNFYKYLLFVLIVYILLIDIIKKIYIKKYNDWL